jgi:hypothetical protein
VALETGRESLRMTSIGFGFKLVFLYFYNTTTGNNIKKRKMPTADIEVFTRDQKYLLTVNSLRSRNFSKNLPFLILSEICLKGR